MTEDEKYQQGGGVRRVSKKDRKSKIETGPLFPPEEKPVSSPEPVTIINEESAPIAEGEQAAPTEQAHAPVGYAPQPPRGNPFRKTDFIALFFLILTAATCVWYAAIWNDPYGAVNPLSPPTPFIVITATFPVGAQPALPQNPTPDSLAGEEAYPFAMAESGVLYTPNANGRGCSWASIAGAVIGLNGEPLSGYGVEISGELGGAPFREKVFSGSALTFGPGGYEFPLGEAPISGDFTVQLFTPQGAPLSPVYTVRTSDNCEHNVAIVNFLQQSGF
ncbi:MAG: hypothetical protein D6712_20800 [Chloroflexi bacterium]|nr:MAG: hypothetical protein D6712_20800 [Chloroflexota bacterium]